MAPPSTIRPAGRKGGALLLLCGLLYGVAGCRSPQSHRRAADEEVYALIEERRAALFDADAGFTIEPPADSLRRRIVVEGQRPAEPLSLADCLEVAAENNRRFRAEREGLYLAALDLTLSRWQFGNRPFAGIDASVDPDTATVNESAGVTRVLGTGATIVGQIGRDLFRFVNTGDGWDVVRNASLTVTQPLLAGSGSRVVLEPLTQAERDLIYAVRAYERFRRTFAVDVARSVYDLLRAVDELENEERNYENLVDLRERNRAMAEAGRLSEIEADQALQEELSSEARLIRLRADLERARDDFNLFMGLPVDFELNLDRGEFDGLTEEDAILDALGEEEAILLALERRLDHATTRDVLEDRERGVHVAADALRGVLNLTAREGDGDDDSLSLSLSLPLDRRAERNAYRRALIDVEVARRDLEEEADVIRADVRDAFRNTRNARADLRIQQGAVVLAERRVEGALLSLDAGRASTRDVLEAREALVAAQNAATAALIDFTLARLDLYLQLELLRVTPAGIAVAPQDDGSEPQGP